MSQTVTIERFLLRRFVRNFCCWILCLSLHLQLAN